MDTPLIVQRTDAYPVSLFDIVSTLLSGGIIQLVAMNSWENLARQTIRMERSVIIPHAMTSYHTITIPV